jgi:hypothetical protein
MMLPSWLEAVATCIIILIRVFHKATLHQTPITLCALYLLHMKPCAFGFSTRKDSTLFYFFNDVFVIHMIKEHMKRNTATSKPNAVKHRKRQHSSAFELVPG